MTRTKTLAVVGVVLLVALAGCGGTDPDNVSEPTDGVGEDGGVDEGTPGAGEETTAEDGVGEETTAEDGVGEETTEDGMTDGNETTAEDGAADGASDASVTFEDQSSNGSAVTVANVTLPNGGFVAVHNTTDGEVGDVLGNSSFLESGDHENLTVTFENTTISEESDLVVMLYEDTNDNEMYDYPADDSPYLTEDEPVSDDATVSVSEDGAGTDGGAEDGTDEETTEA